MPRSTSENAKTRKLNLMYEQDKTRAGALRQLRGGRGLLRPVAPRGREDRHHEALLLLGDASNDREAPRAVGRAA